MNWQDQRTLRQLDQAVTDARTDAEREAQRILRDTFKRVIARRDGEPIDEQENRCDERR